MRIVGYRDIDPVAWDRFAREYGWFWHTSFWRDYTLAFADGTDPADFAIMDGNDLLAVTAMSRSHAPAIRDDLDRPARLRILTRCLSESEHTRRQSLSPLVPHFPERLMEFAAITTVLGYEDRSLTSRVIDLTQSEDELLRAMSKGHRHAVTNGKHITSRVATSETSFSIYHHLHRQAHGKVRPLDTFAEMRRWVELGNAAVVLARTDDVFTGATLLMIFGESAAYSSTATIGKPGVVGHAMMWTAIRWLKAQGLERFELGPQYRGRLSHDTSTVKEQNISLFKRGFGGDELPLMIREPPTARSTHGTLRRDR